MAHANARLTPAGRLILVGRIAAQPQRPIAHIAHEMGISRTTAYRWWARYQQLGQAGLVDRPSIPAHSPRRTPPAWSSASSGCAGVSGWGRPGSPPASVCRPRPSTGSWSVTAATGWGGWTAQPAARSAAMSIHGQATWSTWTSRSWVASLSGAATGSTAGLPGRSTVAPTDQAAAMTTCTPRSTTTRGWPMWRSW
jgi:leucine-zipper of insertion element IS481